MAQIRRELVTMMTRPQSNIETQTKTEKNFGTTPPKTFLMVKATGAELADAAGSALDGGAASRLIQFDP
jgi:hypothetical protein